MRQNRTIFSCLERVFCSICLFLNRQIIFNICFSPQTRKDLPFFAFTTMWRFEPVLIALHSSKIVIIDLCVQYTRIVWKVKVSRAFNKFITC